MYGRILKKFVEQEFTSLEIEEQAGFRTGRSTMDHIFSIRQLIEKRITFQQPLHLGPVSDTTFTFPSTDNCSLKLWQVQIGFPKAHLRRSQS